MEIHVRTRNSFLAVRNLLQRHNFMSAVSEIHVQCVQHEIIFRNNYLSLDLSVFNFSRRALFHGVTLTEILKAIS